MATKKTAEQKIIDRLSRAEGQIRALRNTLELETLDCKKFITQVKAVRSALKAVNEEFVIAHIATCKNLPEKKRDSQLAEAIQLLVSD
jgi:DNA-binding FrmR family transcriptional regulator